MTYKSAVLADAPTAYWRLDEPSGTTAADSSGNAHTGTITGTVTLAQGGALQSDTNQAMVFDGTTGFISATAFNWPTTLTLEAWIRTRTTALVPILSNRLVGGAGSYLAVTAAGKLQYLNSSGSPTTTVGTTAIADGVPHHVAVTVAGNAVVLYVDGTQDVAATQTGNAAFNQALFLGKDLVSPATFFPDLLDDVAIYSTTLSAARILAHYNAALAKSLVGTVALIPAAAVGASDVVSRVLIGAGRSANHVRLSALADQAGTLQTSAGVSVQVSVTDANGTLVLPATTMAYTSSGQWDVDTPAAAWVRLAGPWQLQLLCYDPTLGTLYETLTRSVFDGGG